MRPTPRPSPRRNDRVLMVTHDATLTGAPMVALLVARSLVDAGLDVTVVSRRKGPLLTEFMASAPTRRELLGGVRRRLWLVRGLGLVAWALDVVSTILTLTWHRPRLVYLNTSASAVYLHAARWLRLPTLLHVHESSANTDHFLAEARVRSLDGVRLVACSPSVHEHLVARTGRAEDEVELIVSVPDDVRVSSRAAESADALPGGLVVGAVGSVGHRKGTDLWLEVVRHLQRVHGTEPTTFVWVGDTGPGPQDGATVESVPPGVEFRGAVTNPYPLMASFDVMTLPSRDDPFPLVVLEAMGLGRPVVAFDVGSVADQVGDGGVVVPPGDVEAFARAVGALLSDEELRRRTGEAARARARTLYSSTVFAERITGFVLGALEEPSTTLRKSR